MTVLADALKYSQGVEGNIMNLVTALAIVIGVMGGIATWAAVTVGSPFILIWAVFIGWASFIVLLMLGVTPINAGICVGATVLIMILGAKIPALGAIPAQVYGYAATAGLFLMAGAAYGEGNASVIGVAGAIIASMVVGNVLGFISEKIVGALTAKRGKFAGGCDHVKTFSKAGPIDNHTCHCNVCKNVTGQLTTHVVFFNHGDLKVDNPSNLDRVPFNADNADGPLDLCVCKDCGTPVMLDDKQKRIRAVVPNLMGMDPEAMPADYHAFYDESKGYKRPSDGRPVHEGLRPDFAWPQGA